MNTENEAVVKQKVSSSENLAFKEGTTLEAPLTRPFEGFTYLKKEWVDQDENIEKVCFNMCLSLPSLPADWDKTESFDMMPEWGTDPLKRSWIVRLPTHLGDKDRYLFNYFYQITFKDGTEKVSDTFTSFIVPKEVEFIDHSGQFTHIWLHWSLKGWSYPQDTELELEGIKWGEEFSVSQAPYRKGDRLYENGRKYAVNKIPNPRVFKAKIWAPKGEEINYCFKLAAFDNETEIIQWDNNAGNNYKLKI